MTARRASATTGQEIVALRGHKDVVTSASFSPDGARMDTASDDRTARLWDATTGQQLTTLRGHEDPLSNGSFSPDGARIVTASWDGTARIWNAATGRKIIALRGHEDLCRVRPSPPMGRASSPPRMTTRRAFGTRQLARSSHE